jgi:hypothetical protein
MINTSVIRNLFCVAAMMISLSGYAQSIQTYSLLNKITKQYEKIEFDVVLKAPFSNPHDAREITLNLVSVSPAGKEIKLPCYFVSGDKNKSFWKAKFAPQESGKYTYQFKLDIRGQHVNETKKNAVLVEASSRDGFLHVNDYWTLRFDSGKPFRGIGENIGWEARSFENEKWTYDYLLPTLSSNGANFFRTWMCVWNLPVAWNKVNDTKRYSSSKSYFNESGIKRMDELVQMCDSLGLYFMLSIDAHGALIPGGEWKYNSHNKINGGPAATPEEFFSNEESRAMYRNRLRYLIARWGYSPSIAAWEFFNEIDNAVFTPTPHDSVLIDNKIITEWHDEMSTYLYDNDPYNHIVTTSISHRDIAGMNELKNIDLNQKHIYNRTEQIAPTLHRYSQMHQKPYVIGEFGYDWNWDNVRHEYGEGFDHDYRRGLWYGLFSPTPILPMTWWWEFFDERKMTPYFKSVRKISDMMLESGGGSFDTVNVSGGQLETYSVKCGDDYFVYALNNTGNDVKSDVNINMSAGSYRMKSFKPSTGEIVDAPLINGGDVKISVSTLRPREERIFILIREKDTSEKIRNE